MCPTRREGFKNKIGEGPQWFLVQCRTCEQQNTLWNIYIEIYIEIYRKGLNTIAAATAYVKSRAEHDA